MPFFSIELRLRNQKKMPLSSKRFVISTSALNSQGFRVLTSGIDLEGFKKNPLLLWNHIRPKGNSKDQILPLGHWPVEHLQVNGDEISGIPFFDDQDEFAMSIYHKVEGGHIRMCSAGLAPKEVSDLVEDMLPDQDQPTVTKCSLQEASICDIGSNPDSGSADVVLYDDNDNLITLSASQVKHLIKKKTMNKQTTTALDALKKAKKAKEDLTKSLTLAAEKVELAMSEESTTDEDKAQLSAEHDEVKEMSDDDKDQQIYELKLKLKEAEEQLRKMSEAKALSDQDDKEKEAMAEAKLACAQGKITLAQVSDIKDLYLSNPAGTKKYLSQLKAHVPARTLINTSVENEDSGRLKTLSAKTWSELFKSSGDTAWLRQNAPEVYKAKFKEQFGREPKNI